MRAIVINTNSGRVPWQQPRKELKFNGNMKDRINFHGVDNKSSHVAMPARHRLHESQEVHEQKEEQSKFGGDQPNTNTADFKADSSQSSSSGAASPASTDEGSVGKPLKPFPSVIARRTPKLELVTCRIRETQTAGAEQVRSAPSWDTRPRDEILLARADHGHHTSGTGMKTWSKDKARFFGKHDDGSSSCSNSSYSDTQPEVRQQTKRADDSGFFLDDGSALENYKLRKSLSTLIARNMALEREVQRLRGMTTRLMDINGQLKAELRSGSQRTATY